MLPAQRHSIFQPRVNPLQRRSNNFLQTATKKKKKAAAKKPRRRQHVYDPKKVIGHNIPALSINTTEIGINQHRCVNAMDLDLAVDQVRALNTWLNRKKNAGEKAYMVLQLEVLDNGFRQARHSRSRYGKTGLLIEVTNIEKSEESDKPVLFFYAWDRCRWNRSRTSNRGLNSVRVTRSFQATTRWPTNSPTLDTLKADITKIAAECAVFEDHYPAFYEAITSIKKSDHKSFFRLLLDYVNILELSIEELHDFIDNPQPIGLARKYKEYLGRIPKKKSTGRIASSEAQIVMQMRRVGVPEEVIDCLYYDIKRFLEDKETIAIERIETVLRMPWKKVLPWSLTPEEVVESRKRLDEVYLGRPYEKRWALAYLNHLAKTGGRDSTPNCFVGPPGVGKTSLGLFFSEVLGRPFSPFNMTTLSREQLEGTESMYQGSMPSILATELIRLGVANPIFFADEIDKAEKKVHSILLHLFDPQHNRRFRDQFLRVFLDYSKILWIAAANDWNALPQPLQERLRRVNFGPYGDRMKFGIAEERILPALLADHGLEPGSIIVPRRIMETSIERRVHEGGVRGFKKDLERLIWFAMETSPNASARNPFVIDRRYELDALREMNRQPVVRVGDHQGKALGVGVDEIEATGRIDRIEVSISDSRARHSGQWQQDTGVQGRDMREVNVTVRSVVANHLPLIWKILTGQVISEDMRIHLTDRVLNNSITVHVPPPGEEVSGPSAGIITTMSVIRELLKTNIPGGCDLIHDLLVTGSVGLEDYIIPIGGERGKLNAAFRVGAKTMVFPEANRENVILALQEIAFDSKWSADKKQENFLVQKGRTIWDSPSFGLGYRGEKPAKPFMRIVFVGNMEDAVRTCFGKEEPPTHWSIIKINRKTGAFWDEELNRPTTPPSEVEPVST